MIWPNYVGQNIKTPKGLVGAQEAVWLGRPIKRQFSIGKKIQIFDFDVLDFDFVASGPLESMTPNRL
jgi:hypothetical protein